MITLSAFLEICECGEHGRFVMPDKSFSREFCCEKDGEVELAKLCKQGQVSDAEVSYLKDCLRRSSIPRDTKDADPLTQLTCAFKNDLGEFLVAKDEEAEPDEEPGIRIH